MFYGMFEMLRREHANRTVLHTELSAEDELTRFETRRRQEKLFINTQNCAFHCFVLLY